MPSTFRMLTAVITMLCACTATPLQAQKLWHSLHRVDSLLSSRYRRGNIDTLYITRPSTNWTLTARVNVSGADIYMQGKDMGVPFKSEIAADFKSTLSLGFNYLGVSLSLALNPAKLSGKYKDFELNLNSYRNRWGFDFIYQDAQNFKGWYESQGQDRLHLPSDVLSMRSLNVNAYYAFNYRRFSYPAAFSQSYIQRRSAGSFLLALSGQGQKTETKKLMESLLRVTNIGVGAGYGYNWVPTRNWLIHISALPTFTVFTHTSLTVDNESIPLKYHFPEVIITARAAIVRQFGKMFVGWTSVYNYTNIGNENDLAIQNTKWRTRLLFGFRL